MRSKHFCSGYNNAQKISEPAKANIMDSRFRFKNNVLTGRKGKYNELLNDVVLYMNGLNN